MLTRKTFANVIILLKKQQKWATVRVKEKKETDVVNCQMMNDFILLEQTMTFNRWPLTNDSLTPETFPSRMNRLAAWWGTQVASTHSLHPLPTFFNLLKFIMKRSERSSLIGRVYALQQQCCSEIYDTTAITATTISEALLWFCFIFRQLFFFSFSFFKVFKSSNNLLGVEMTCGQNVSKTNQS